jgi:LL-diaminopimelate aminotransferase
MKPPSHRMQQSKPSFFSRLAVKIENLRQAGHDVIRLDEGSPDLPPSPEIIAALIKSASSDNTHSYQPHRGPNDLRAAWAAMYQRVHNVSLDPDSDVLPLLGTKEGIFHLSLAYLDAGDVALIPDPGYITYSRGAEFSDGMSYFIPLLQENAYLPDLDSIPLDVLEKAKLLWLNYPSNPTAAVAPLAFLEHAVAFARKHNLLLCHDAAYAQITFDGYHAASILEVPGAKEVAVEFNSLSKTYNMAGWRLGALVGNPQVVRTLFTLKTNADSSHFLPILQAATAAMTGDQEWIKARNKVYQQRRDLVISALHSLGLMAAAPQASLYIWCPVPVGWTCEDFTNHLLDQADVSLTPGTVFGSHGQGFVRISLTAPNERLILAMQRISLLSFEKITPQSTKTPMGQRIT